MRSSSRPLTSEWCRSLQNNISGCRGIIRSHVHTCSNGIKSETSAVSPKDARHNETYKKESVVAPQAYFDIAFVLLLNCFCASTLPFISVFVSSSMAQQEAFANGQSKKSSPGIPWRTRIALSLVSVVTDYSRRRNGTVNRRLLGIFGLKTSANPNPVNGVKTFDVIVDPSRHLWFRLFVPTTDESRNLSSLPIIVFFHGGGFVYLSADTKVYDAVCRRFARKCPAVVVSVDYRLAPEHRYPAQYDDGFDVLKFLDNEKNRGLLPENTNFSCCFLAGDSAGGNLAHRVAKRASELASTFDALKVIGLVAIQPFFGGEERTEAELRLEGVDALISVRRTDWMWNAFLPPGEGMDRDHEVINVCGPRAVDISKLDNFPPTMVVVGGLDPLQDWQRRYYEWLKMSGKNVHLSEYPTMVHAFYLFPEVPESTQLILEIKDFIHKQCSRVVTN